MKESERLRREIRRQRAENRRLQRELERLQQDKERLQQDQERLQKKEEELKKQIRRLSQDHQELLNRIENLERKTARQAAPFRRRDTDKIPSGQHKKPGRKKGHQGRCRPVPERIDERVEVPLPGCPQCGGALEDVLPLEQYIEEIPPLRPQVVKIVTYQGCCAQCGPVRSLHPLQTSTARGAAQVQLGPRALALAALLNKGHGLTLRSTCRVLKQLLGLRISPGGLSQALDRMADRLRPQYQRLWKDLQRAPAVFADETSWWVGQPGWWLWVHTSPETTVYRVEPSRAGKIVEQTLGPDFKGTLVSDCLNSYDPLPYRKHKCIAHHLKAIKQARDGPHNPDPQYLDQWKLFFQTVIALHSLTAPPHSRIVAQGLPHLERWCDRLLAQAVTQPGDQSIQNRLRKQRPHLLTCLYHPAAEPTNNRAERALRPAVIARKLSCGNKTIRGKTTWEILASLAASCQQQGIDFTDFVSSRIPLQPPR